MVSSLPPSELVGFFSAVTIIQAFSVCTIRCVTYIHYHLWVSMLKGYDLDNLKLIALSAF